MRDQKIARMRKKLEVLTSEKGIEVDSEVQEEIEYVIQEKRSYINFRKVFWEHSF